MKILIKRAYDPVTKNDGFRVLVDGLWPRGITKANARIDLWDKDVAPSKELRSWFHMDKEKRFESFVKKYERELKKGKAVGELKAILKGRGTVTIITGVKDIERSHIPVLLKLLI